MRCGGGRRFSGPVQGDAAAEVEEDKGHSGGDWSSGSGASEEEDDGGEE